MHLALKSAMSRIPYTNKVGETLSSIADPAAAYSLRALGGGDPMVARVRRSSDDAEKDFTASDMGAALENWVNGDVVITNGTFTNISGTYDTFSGASSSGFTATNTASDGRAKSNVTISTPQIGDKFRINYNLTLNSGSAILFAFATSTGASSSTGFTLYASGAGSFVLTATKTDIASLRVNAIGNVDFVLSDVSITAIQSSGHVTTWYDQSGNDNHATQGTAASQPKIVDGGVLVSDGVDFDGASTQLSTASPILTSDTFYCASVLKHSTGTSASGNEIIFGQYDASSSGRWFVFVNTSFQLRFGSNATDPIAGNFIDPLSASATLISATATNNLATLYSNGNSTTSDAYSGFSPALIPFTIGKPNSNNNSVNGTISEIIIYNSDQSSNREAIETNINNHYDIY